MPALPSDPSATRWRTARRTSPSTDPNVSTASTVGCRGRQTPLSNGPTMMARCTSSCRRRRQIVLLGYDLECSDDRGRTPGDGLGSDQGLPGHETQDRSVHRSLPSAAADDLPSARACGGGGGGSGIALCRDLVVMSDDARIRYMMAWVPAVTARATNEIFTARIPSLLASR